VQGDELCDDGNLTDGDGCQSDCLLAPGSVCFGSPSVCGNAAEVVRIPEQAATIEDAVDLGASLVVISAGADIRGRLRTASALTVVGEPGATLRADLNGPAVDVDFGGDLRLVGVRILTEGAADEGVNIAPGGTVRLEHVDIDSRDLGIRAFAGSTLIMRNSRVDGFRGGIDLGTDAFDIVGVEVTNSGAGSPSVGGVRFRLTGNVDSRFAFNTVVGNSLDQAGVGDGLHCDGVVGIVASIVVGNGDNNVEGSCTFVDSIVAQGGMGTNVLDVDPLLDGNNRPLPGSPAIDAGDGHALATLVDRYGVPRPSGTAADLGAYERPDPAAIAAARDGELRVKLGEVGPLPLRADLGPDAEFLIEQQPASGMVVTGGANSGDYLPATTGTYEVRYRARADSSACYGPAATIVIRVFPSDWWDVDYLARQPLPLSLASGDEQDVPLLVRLGGPGADVEVDWSTLNADASDLRFVFDDGIVPQLLPAELEAVEEETRVLAWTKLPSIGASAGTLYLYSHNPAPGVPPDFREVWSDYEAVFHFSGRGSSAPGGYDWANNGSPDTSDDGLLGRDANFDNNDPAVLDVQGISLMRNVREYTVTCWAAPSTINNNVAIVSIAEGGTLSNQSRLALELNYQGTPGQAPLRALVRAPDGSVSQQGGATTGANDVTTGSGYHLLGVSVEIEDNGGTVSTFQDNILRSSSVGFTANATSDTDPLAVVIGAEDLQNNSFFRGRLDECRFAPIARSFNWMSFHYVNVTQDIINEGAVQTPAP
jgi:cysteine-rich repeat protein